jgi:single-strand DNA-binding protein
MSVNKVILVGNVGKDPEVKTISEGVKVASFSLATTEKGFTAQNGTVIPDKTEWHNIVAWKGLAEISEKWIKKGSQLYVEGKLKTEMYEKDGVKHYNTKIVAENMRMLGKKEEGTQESKAEPMPTQEPSCPTHGEDDLPF